MVYYRLLLMMMKIFFFLATEEASDNQLKYGTIMKEINGKTIKVATFNVSTAAYRFNKFQVVQLTISPSLFLLRTPH